MNKNISIFSTLITIFIVYGIFGGFLFYWGGYISGLFITWFVGERIVEGLGILGINITTHQIPMICGTLSVLGSFFGKGHTTTNTSK